MKLRIKQVGYWYYPQYRSLFFWANFPESDHLPVEDYPKLCASLQEAQNFLKEHLAPPAPPPPIIIHPYP